MANIYPPDYGSLIGQVRLLIPDEDTPYHFSDAQCQAFLTKAGDDVSEAAALALESWATDLAKTLIGITTDDLKVDASGAIKALKDRARDLRSESGGIDFLFPEDDTSGESESWPWV